ncbi:hypothetical protein LTR10_013627 [Elasticomyces elasticus]|uniref:Zn(2)-C6 fungal-type domain-containing protein n=1 Tax=Exophiala sideris TaxID=1016849 RepID=A0ABR0JRS4_9EURO|nr:hypothetical protein LTR10_013627 [Elasticomyces elasticus]KAK5039765.1 hypothetical protein LTS07_000260 [Exophiala sideris]KAK5041317.1 hypothetical protein LTR13_002792 [Exophiala sideris]KAK5068144.1 hypothetical protein LTR69_000262 [Exophiala sideris]KAK5187445.1 hypothetical protein LTR44_000261 [Eurotiomycetes sp. CCFEE 6388]
MAMQIDSKSILTGVPRAAIRGKRRATKACHYCRVRKVRCDVIGGGIPCNNCRLDEVHCMVPEKKSRGKPQQKNEDSLRQSIDQAEQEDEASTLESILPSFEKLATPPTTPGVVAPSGNLLPAYIQPIPTTVPADDIEYLQRKGAFTMPDTNLRNQLLHSYVQFVHPFLPIIELEDFLTAIERNKSTNTVSLFLFQAVMFAGALHADITDPASYGYTTLKDMQRSLFNRLRLLYNFDYESDQITILQAVLLMTYWYEDMDEPKDVMYWLDIAISMARRIDLTAQKTSRTYRLCKRIWWSCFIRDRLITLDLSCPPRMFLEHHDVPMLEVSDFETRALPTELTQLLGGCSTVEDSGRRVALAQMCIGLTQLCVHIGPILNKQLCEQQDLGAPRTNIIHRLSKSISISTHEALQYDQLLSKWCQRSDLQNLHNFIDGSYDRLSAIDCKTIHLHRGLLASIYLAVVIILYRPLCWGSEDANAPELRRLAERKAREAANKITIIYRDLFAHNLLDHLPYTGVTCLLYATDVHLHDIDSLDSATNVAGICKLRTCIRTLERLRQRYSLTGLNIWLISAPTRHSQPTGVASAMANPVMTRTTLSSDTVTEQGKPPAKRMRTTSPENMGTGEYQPHNSLWTFETPDILSAGTTPSLVESDLSSCSTSVTRGMPTWVNGADHDVQKLRDAIDPRNLTPTDPSLQELPDGSMFCSADEDSLHAGMQWLQEFDVGLPDEAKGDIELSTQQSPG